MYAPVQAPFLFAPSFFRQPSRVCASDLLVVRTSITETVQAFGLYVLVAMTEGWARCAGLLFAGSHSGRCF